MEGRFPQGILFVLANCADPAKDEEFNDWYNRTHLPDILASGLFTTACRYQNTNPQPGEAKYLAIYETDRDLSTLSQGLNELREQLQGKGRMHPTLQVIRRTIFRRVGPEFRSGDKREVSGLLAVESLCTDPNREEKFNDWYNQRHILDMLGTGRYHTGYRFQDIDPQPGQGKYSALYETDAPDPEAVSQDILHNFRPKWLAEGRWIDTIEVTWRASFRRLHQLP